MQAPSLPRSKALSKPWVRWVIAVTLSVMAFIGCWASFQFGVRADTAVALGWAILPFSVVLALTGVWAHAVRRESDKDPVPTSSKVTRIVQSQRAADRPQQLQVGRDLRINE